MRPSTGERSETIRQARPDDIEPILTLLMDYELPRSSFEPLYMHDTSYRPEHSWIVEQNGRLLSHLRIYDRWMRVGQVTLHIAGIGNVITAKDARGRGYAARIMRAMLPVLAQEGYVYSLLWTHLPDLYGRSGWVPIEQELVRAVLPPSLVGPVRIGPFHQQDLPALVQLYETANAERTGTTVRSPEYWRELPLWLQEKPDDLLVAHDNPSDAPVGYVRSRVMQDTLEILELASAGDSPNIARALLTASSMQRDGRLQGHFPPSMRTIFLPGEFDIRDDPGLMGRVLNLAELVSALASVWVERVCGTRRGEGFLALSLSAGAAVLRVSREGVQLNQSTAIGPDPPLNEREFAHLLFHGFDERARTLMGNRADAFLLSILFPEQDFVIWQADQF